jgi:cell division protein FtsZ
MVDEVGQLSAQPAPKVGMSFDNANDFESHKARIVVVGAGGGGSNTITRLTEMGIKGAQTLALNTDAKHLQISKADKRILIGKSLTRGLGAGGYPEIGKQAALENRKEIQAMLQNTDLVFLTCGLGGGTGTGSLPAVAKMAKEAGAITIAVVTMPFKLEGARINKAEEGLAALRQSTDTVIVIENQKLLNLAGDLPLKAAFGVADNLIATMIKGITETITEPSLVNLDYADVRAVMRDGGVAFIGVGESDNDENRAQEAIYRALNHPLLEADHTGAKGALIQVIGGNDITMDDISKVGEIVQSQLDSSAQVIWGARILPELGSNLQVITIITGVKSPYILGRSDKASPSASRASRELGLEVL